MLQKKRFITDGKRHYEVLEDLKSGNTSDELF